MKQFEYCVFIGRFSCFHKAHHAILLQAFEISEKVLLVLGSSNASRSVKNPWTAVEREDMIRANLTEEQLGRIEFIHMKDYTYNNNMWISVLQEKVVAAVNGSENVGLIGFKSDESSFYLDVFDQFKFISHEPDDKFHATEIRSLYFSHDNNYKNYVPAGTVKYLEKWKKTTEFTNVYEEQKHIEEYKERWRGSPFTPIFTTVDCLVIKSGHLLLVRRKCNPGKGLLALPGGFLNPNEYIEDGALRELKEETRINIPLPELRKAIKERKVFDDPGRSARGRTISHGFLVDLGVGPLPKVKGSDDAMEAMWLPLGDYHELATSFFEDHYHIISSFITKY